MGDQILSYYRIQKTIHNGGMEKFISPQTRLWFTIKSLLVAVRCKLKAAERAPALAIGILVALSLIAASMLEAVPNAAVDTHLWMGPDGQPLPFQTHEEIRDFLRTAKVIKMEAIPVGVTKPRKVLLEKDGIHVNACFKMVEIQKDKWIVDRPEPAIRHHWRDSYIFECAAYELSRMLGLDNVLPVVQREIEDEEGVLQIWLEDALMERKRAKLNLTPPDFRRHEMQMEILNVFDALVHNDDRNPTNILYDPQWKLWMLDHTRCFPRVKNLPEPNEVKRCERTLWQNLQKLEDDAVKERLKSYLKKRELNDLLKRREKLVDHIQELIKQQGEVAVIYTLD